MTDSLKEIEEGSIKYLLEKFADVAGDYIEKNGVDKGTARDVLGVSIRTALSTVDEMDGKQDNKIEKVIVSEPIKALLKSDNEDFVKMISPFLNGIKKQIEKLPEQFSIPDKVMDEAVKRLVNSADVNHNGRIEKSEISISAPISQRFVSDLLKGAVKG